MQKKTLFLFMLSAAVEVLVGIFSFSPAVIADGIVTFTYRNSERRRAVVCIITAVAGVGIGVWSFLNLMKNTGYYEYSPQIWSLPFLVAAFIIKLFACMEAAYLRIFVVSTAIATVSVVGSYWIYHIEPAVGLALSALAVLISLKMLFPKNKRRGK